MAADLTNPSTLEQVLEALGANNTDTIREAEAILKPFVKEPASIPHMLQQIEHSSKVQVRHVASLIMKRRIGGIYEKCDAASREELRNTLLRLVTVETVNAVRTALAGVVARMAKTVFSNGEEWQDLFSILMQLIQSEDAPMRALCFNLLAQLAEEIPDNLKPHVETITEMILAGCNDAASEVAVAAVKSATTFVASLSDEPEVMTLQPVLSPVLAVMEKCLESGDEEVVSEGLDMFQECVAMDQPLVNNHTQAIVSFSINVMGNLDLESSTRSAAGQTIMSLIEMRPKLLSKENLVEPILQVFVQAIANSDSSGAGQMFSRLNQDDEDDDDDYSPEMEVQEIAQMCLDRMAMSLPSKSFVEPALAMCSQGMASSEMPMRKAGCAVLGIIAEGCCCNIREMLPDILPRLLEAVQDPEYYVRESACFALGQFSEHCQPEILYYHQSILPVIFGALEDPRPTVQGTSCYVLENFCENLLPQTLTPFLPMLMERLVSLLHSPQKATQEMAMAAIAASAVASEDAFLPYAAATVEILKEIIFISEPEMFNLRGRALECLGHVAVAIGNEHFAPYLDMGMQAAMQGVQFDDDNLKEYAYTFIANCAKVMGHTFDQHLEMLVPHLLEVISEPELHYGEQENELGGLDDDDEDDDIQLELRFHEGYINTKKAALTAIGSLADHTAAAFFPYLSDTLNTLLEEKTGPLWSIHRLIRSESLLILQYMVKVTCCANGLEEPPAKGVMVELHPAIHGALEAVLTTYINATATDMEKLAVAYALEGLESCIKLTGVACLAIEEESTKSTFGDLIMNNIQMLLKEKAKCQTVFKQDDDDEEDEDHDNLITDAVCDIIATLAKVIGEKFMSYFEHFAKYLLKYTKKNRIHSDRSTAIGCFAEVIEEIGPVAGEHYADALFPVLKAGVADSMESVRRNSAYCIGILCNNAPEKCGPMHLQMLQWLYPLCVRSSDEIVTDAGGADIDNALAAVARMIMVSGGGFPLDQVLPVMFAAMPLRSDFGEGLHIFRCFCGLATDGNAAMLGLLPQALVVFSQVFSDELQYNDETKALVVSCLKHMAGSVDHQQVLQNAVSQLQDQPDVAAVIDGAIKS